MVAPAPTGKYVQDDPKTHIGYEVNLPDPGAFPAGHIYHSVDTLQAWISVVDIVNGTRRWDPLSANAGALKFSGAILSLAVSFIAPPGTPAQVLAMGDSGALLTTNAATSPFLNYLPGGNTTKVSANITVASSAFVADAQIRIYKNGVDTGIRVVIPGGTTAGQFFIPATALPLTFTQQNPDGIDLVVVTFEPEINHLFVFSAIVQLY